MDNISESLTNMHKTQYLCKNPNSTSVTLGCNISSTANETSLLCNLWESYLWTIQIDCHVVMCSRLRLVIRIVLKWQFQIIQIISMWRRWIQRWTMTITTRNDLVSGIHCSLSCEFWLLYVFCRAVVLGTCTCIIVYSYLYLRLQSLNHCGILITSQQIYCQTLCFCIAMINFW